MTLKLHFSCYILYKYTLLAVNSKFGKYNFSFILIVREKFTDLLVSAQKHFRIKYNLIKSRFTRFRNKLNLDDLNCKFIRIATVK